MFGSIVGILKSVTEIVPVAIDFAKSFSESSDVNMKTVVETVSDVTSAVGNVKANAASVSVDEVKDAATSAKDMAKKASGLLAAVSAIIGAIIVIEKLTKVGVKAGVIAKSRVQAQKTKKKVSKILERRKKEKEKAEEDYEESPYEMYMRERSSKPRSSESLEAKMQRLKEVLKHKNDPFYNDGLPENAYRSVAKAHYTKYGPMLLGLEHFEFLQRMEDQVTPEAEERAKYHEKKSNVNTKARGPVKNNNVYDTVSDLVFKPTRFPSAFDVMINKVRSFFTGKDYNNNVQQVEVYSINRAPQFNWLEMTFREYSRAVMDFYDFYYDYKTGGIVFPDPHLDMEMKVVNDRTTYLRTMKTIFDQQYGSDAEWIFNNYLHKSAPEDSDFEDIHSIDDVRIGSLRESKRHDGPSIFEGGHGHTNVYNGDYAGFEFYRNRRFYNKKRPRIIDFLIGCFVDDYSTNPGILEAAYYGVGDDVTDPHRGRIIHMSDQYYADTYPADAPLVFVSSDGEKHYLTEYTDEFKEKIIYKETKTIDEECEERIDNYFFTDEDLYDDPEELENVRREFKEVDREAGFIGRRRGNGPITISYGEDDEEYEMYNNQYYDDDELYDIDGTFQFLLDDDYEVSSYDPNFYAEDFAILREANDMFGAFSMGTTWAQEVARETSRPYESFVTGDYQKNIGASMCGLSNEMYREVPTSFGHPMSKYNAHEIDPYTYLREVTTNPNIYNVNEMPVPMKPDIRDFELDEDGEPIFYEANTELTQMLRVMEDEEFNDGLVYPTAADNDTSANRIRHPKFYKAVPDTNPDLYDEHGAYIVGRNNPYEIGYTLPAELRNIPKEEKDLKYKLLDDGHNSYLGRFGKGDIRGIYDPNLSAKLATEYANMALAMSQEENITLFHSTPILPEMEEKFVIQSKGNKEK